MMIVEEQVAVMSQHLVLNNQRSVYWLEKNTLIISDLHLGKSAHFRKNGIAISNEIIKNDLQRLGQLLQYYKAERLIVAGDLIHAGENSEFSLFKEWRMEFPQLKIILTKGNHDKISHQYLTDLGITEIVNQYQEDNILVSHDEIEIEGLFLITGHLHPGLKLKMPTQSFVKMACFVLKKQHLILPAFSHFTGLDTSVSNLEATFFIVDDQSIIRV